MPHDTFPLAPPLPTAVLDRVMAGQPADGDMERLDAWLAGMPERDAIVHALRTLHPTDAADGIAAAAALRVLTRRLDAIERTGVPMLPDVTSADTSLSRAAARPSLYWQRLGASPSRAALWTGLALATLCAFAFGLYQWTPWGADWMSPSHVYATTTGQRQTVTLDDGTRVTLAPGSRLAVARNFGGHSRTVTLTGEAAFMVGQTPASPFIVRTGDVAIRVLGTAFAVRQALGATQVVVVSGKVSVTNHDARTPSPTSVVLGAADLVRVTDSTMDKTTVRDPAQFLSWTAEGRLVFRDTPVPEMLATLGRWYGYQFKLADGGLAGQHMNATFDKTPPEVMLRTLQTVLDVTLSVARDADEHGKPGPPIITVRPREAAGRSNDRRQFLDSLVPHMEVGRK